MNWFIRQWQRTTLFFRGLLVLALVVGVGFFSYPYIQKNAHLFTRVQGQASQKIAGLEVPSATVGNQTEAAPTIKPVYTPDQVRAEQVGKWRHLGIPWNGQVGLLYANGGANTSRGSIMSRYGLNLGIEKQDMYNVMQGELLAFAQAFKDGNKDPSVGAHSVTIMGDGAPGFLAGLQPNLDKLGLHAKIIGATGRSFGEDKCMGPAEWADDPQKARGGLVAGVLRDGDIHICLIWAQINGVPVNPDEKTYDPDALNFYATDSYDLADAAYINRTCVDRPVVKKGKGTGKTENVCVQGTATWTPGDVNVLKKKGGVVSLLSTRENGAQMFATIIVIDEWARENPATVTNFLKAALDGSAEVARDRGKLRQASVYSAQVWKVLSAEEWEQYYYGRTEDSRGTGRQVRLGGSQALGLASNLEYFLPAGNSLFDRVYKTFGDLDRKLYPDVMPEYPSNVVNTTFLEKIRDTVGDAGRGAVMRQFTGSENEQVGSRSYSINFAVGSATILPSSTDDLEQILNNVSVGSDLFIEVNGYASIDGNTDANQRLSEARAESVRQWLVKNAPRGLITSERVRVTGFGATNLLCESMSEACHRQNRRVEIRLLGAGG